MVKIDRKNVDWKGRQFGQLTIISSFYEPTPGGSKGYFECACSCGKESTPRMDGVLSGAVVSCGCYRAHLSRTRFGYGPNEAIKNDMIKRYKDAAASREVEWLLTDEEALLLFSQNCYYCWQVPSTIHQKGSHFQGSFTYNGIDRIDNEPYYGKTNSVTCCKHCNLAKRALTRAQFLDHIEKIYGFKAKPHIHINVAGLLETKAVIINRLFKNEYGRRAKKLIVPFKLSLETFILLTQQDCYYCGAPPSNEITRGKHSYIYSGLDRLEGPQGYVDDNVVPCCHVCNLMKRSKNHNDFRIWINNVHENTIRRSNK